jgi:hypothetical protein
VLTDGLERQKATRRLNKLQKEVAAHEGDALPEDLEKRLHDAQVELNYTLHYPHGEKYISLFKDPGSNPAVVEKRDAIKKDIAQRMKDNTLGARTLERGSTEAEGEEEEESPEPAKTKKRKNGDSKAKEGKKSKKRKEEPENAKADTIENDDFFEF